MASEGGVGYSLLNGQSLDSSFPLLNETQMVYDEILSSFWKICFWFSLKETIIIAFLYLEEGQ